MAASAVMAVLALILLGIGAVAWSMPQPNPVKLSAGATTPLGQTPWFDSGSTVFAAIDPTERTTPGDWDCRLQTAGSAARTLGGTPNPDLVGTRVVDDQSLFPVVTIGTSGAGDTISCSGPRADTGVAMWVLPTDAGLPRVALSLVVAGIALLGAAALVHPRARGLTRFGR
ncbi:hypothetical protein AZH51_17995 [Branchiibius sp. NY16-3462-2]|nr:hypothetical protein AZH51_17995 [Branchiibius sp. NY16-3462-2]